MTHFTKYKLFPFISFLLLVPPLSFLPCFPSQFCFNNYSMHHIFALVICPFCSIFILFCSICYHLYPFTLSLFHLFLSHCSMPPQPCRLCIVCTTSLHPSSTLYLLLPVCFILSPIFSLSCLPFPSSCFLLLCSSRFLHLLVFLCTDLSPMKIKTGKTLRSQVRCPPLSTHSTVLNTWVGHCQRLLCTLLAT